MNSTQYIVVCAVALSVISGTQGIFLLQEPVKYALLNFIPNYNDWYCTLLQKIVMLMES